MPESLTIPLNDSQLETFSKAREASDRYNYNYAITLLQQLLREVPGNVECRRLLRANELHKIKSASAFEKLKLQPLLLKAATVLKKSPLEAISIAEDVLAIDPRSEQGNELLADAAMAASLPAVAIVARETLREVQPDNIGNLKNLGKLYIQIKKSEKALNCFDSALKLQPNDGEALKGMKDASASHASKQGSWEDESNYRASLKNEKQSADLEQESRVVKSSEAIDQQIERLMVQYNENNNNLNVVIKIADLFERKEDLATALSFYDWASHLTNQGDPEIEKRIDKIKTRQFEEVLRGKQEALKAATPESQPALQSELDLLNSEYAAYRFQNAKDRVARYPNDNILRYELGKALVEVGQYKEAVPELQLAIKAPNVRYQAFNMLGIVFWKRKMLDFAVKQFQTADSEMPVMDDLKKEVIYNLGCVLEEEGKKTESLEQFKRIYEVDSQYRDVSHRVESSYGN